MIKIRLFREHDAKAGDPTYNAVRHSNIVRVSVVPSAGSKDPYRMVRTIVFDTVRQAKAFMANPTTRYAA